MLQASNQLYNDSMQLIDIIIIFVYHTRSEHKLQKLNSVHKSMEGYQKLHVIEVAAYANQTKLYNVICNNNKRQKHTLIDANIQNNLQRQQYYVWYFAFTHAQRQQNFLTVWSSQRNIYNDNNLKSINHFYGVKTEQNC